MEDQNKANNPFLKKGFSTEKLVKYFFASNAGLTILILILIIAFLLKEGLGFFPGYQRDLEVYRITGMEYVDIFRKDLTSHEQLASLMNRAYFAEVNGKAKRELNRSTEASEIVSKMDEVLSPTRDKYFSTKEQENSSAESLDKITEQYKLLIPVAAKNIPKAVHLTEEEHNAIIAAVSNRAIDVEDTPELVAKLTAEYSEAQQKFSAPLAGTKELLEKFEASSGDLSTLVNELTNKVIVSKDALQKADIVERDKATLFAAANSAKTEEERKRLINDANAAVAERPDVVTPRTEMLAARTQHEELVKKLTTEVQAFSSTFQADYQTVEAKKLHKAALHALPVYVSDLIATPHAIQSWNADAPVKLMHAITSFFTGKDWITGGEWQDFYGILPLLVGSLMIAFVALLIAIPVGVGAAIYTNQFASKKEQDLIKPTIEFIQAIPSVVLGFIGIFVVGNALRNLSEVSCLSWFPGFPMDERLNIFTAGCLLALMSIPTIFTLSEDAINNVPAAHAEAADSLGATRIQTTFRVIIPAAISGIIAAILLGFGRVIGETMVVLLVAGNRIKIPDFSAGIGAFFQPSHTMTGIIAQELGEVPIGSVHYRALFIVGIFLFAIVLGINVIAHRVTHKMKH